jgi:hypothetical protein
LPRIRKGNGVKRIRFWNRLGPLAAELDKGDNVFLAVGKRQHHVVVPEAKGVSLSCNVTFTVTEAYARVAELEDALDLGSSGVTHTGSNPVSRISII